jgi:NAD(P)-dependent dehydrogenase (short-subunit alcohol dehydrogenase family)
MSRSKVWLITGVSSGFGRQLVTKAAQAGHVVIGTVRRPEQVSVVDAASPANTHGAVLDVNDHAAGRELVERIVKEHGGLDVLVNNAGYGLFGAVEEADMAEVRAQMETNFFGALALTQAVLPVMRRQRSGHIIQISSQAGVSSTPGMGIYNASKHALEGFSEALHGEVATLGIHVTLVEPGPFRTLWAGPSMHYAATRIPDYASATDGIRARFENTGPWQPGDPERAARAIVQMAASATPPLRLPLGAIAVATLRKKLERVAADVNAWESVAKDADFPK